MSTKDQSLRATSIPYYANVWGYNRSFNSDTNISLATDSQVGDLANMIPLGSPSKVNAIRVLQPIYGSIVEANLNLKFTLRGSDSAKKFRIAIGNFVGKYTRNTIYSDSYINASHLKITGRESPYDIAAGGTFNINRLNLAPALYKRGDSEFRDDAFVVLLVFDTAPSTASGYSFTKFEVECTAQMGLY